MAIRADYNGFTTRYEEDINRMGWMGKTFIESSQKNDHWGEHGAIMEFLGLRNRSYQDATAIVDEFRSLIGRIFNSNLTAYTIYITKSESTLIMWQKGISVSNYLNKITAPPWRYVEPKVDWKDVAIKAAAGCACIGGTVILLEAGGSDMMRDFDYGRGTIGEPTPIPFSNAREATNWDKYESELGPRAKEAGLSLLQSAGHARAGDIGAAMQDVVEAFRELAQNEANRWEASAEIYLIYSARIRGKNERKLDKHNEHTHIFRVVMDMDSDCRYKKCNEPNIHGVFCCSNHHKLFCMQKKKNVKNI